MTNMVRLKEAPIILEVEILSHKKLLREVSVAADSELVEDPFFEHMVK